MRVAFWMAWSAIGCFWASSALAAENLTKPSDHFASMVSFENAPKRVNDVFPLSDQANKGNWVKIEGMSDEFDGDTLDINKWYPNNPKWRGRPPTRFDGSNVTIKDGEAEFRINQHGDKKLPRGFTHTSGFLKTRQRQLYGYFEAEMKPMDAPWVSAFWMTNVQRDWWTEIDIAENCPGVEENRHALNSNVHVFRAPPDKGNVTKHFSNSKTFGLPFELQKDYHTWGLEWTKEHIRFFIDGVMFREIENTHWHQPLEINVNNESNKWFGAIPDDNRLDGVFRVRHVRSWRAAE